MLTQTLRLAASAMTSMAPGISGAIVSMRTWPRAACQRRSKMATRGLDEILRGMHATAFMAEKRSFKMDAERAGLDEIVVGFGGGFDCVRQSSESRTRCVERRRDCRRKISGHAVSGEELAEFRQFGR